MRTPLLAVLAIMAFLATTAVCEEAREVVTLDDGTELQMHGDEDLSGPKRQLMKKALFGDPVPIPEYDVCVPTMFGCSNDFWCNPEYNLTDAGFGFCQITWPEQERAFAVGLFKKLSWQIPHGSETEKKVLRGFQWVAFAFSLGVLAYYAYNSWKATTGWEEVYVCIVELIKVCLEIWHEPDHPATLYLSAGNFILWLRYGEWLLTCPVILIHLSNLTGLKDNYSKRTMMLLISDIGCIVWGVTSALTTLTWLKWFFFFIGLCYGLSTFFHAGRVYIESYMMLPKGQCRKILRIMAGVYYFSWSAFPILFILGPEGFGHISAYASTIGHTINDMLSKQLWTLLGHHLRNLIHIHIIKHGNLTRKTKMTFLGQDVEVEEMVEEEGDDTVNKGTKELAARQSFIVMRDAMKAKGVEVRATLDNDCSSDGMENGAPSEGKGGMGMGSSPPLQPGRVLVGLLDASMVDFFRAQIAQLSPAIEVVPAVGADNVAALAQASINMGGCDLVLVAPDMLRDRTLVQRLKGMGQRVVAFGWQPAGPMRELIEGSGVDAFIEGPSFGTPLNLMQLGQVLSSAQAQRRQQQMMQMQHQMSMGYGSGMGGPQASMARPGVLNSSPSMAQLAGGSALGSSMSPALQYAPSMAHQQGPGSMSGWPSTAGGPPGGSIQLAHQHSSGLNAGSMSRGGALSPGPAPAAVNPLYNSSLTPSPLASQLAAPAPPAGGADAQDQNAVLAQLMSEIGRLKKELAME